MSDTAAVLEYDRLALTAEIVSAYVSKNSVPVAELALLIASVHATLTQLTDGTPTTTVPETTQLTAAQIRKSITPDALISFEDGKAYKTLRRHLTLRGLTAEAYRAKWSLSVDYPMTAVNYSAKRSALARSLGLGRKSQKSASASASPASEADPAQADAVSSENPKRAGRPRKEAVLV